MFSSLEIFQKSYCLPNLQQAKRKQVFNTKTHKFVLKFAIVFVFVFVARQYHKKDQFSLFFVLCSLFFVLCSLFIVLCSYFVSRQDDKKTIVLSSFSEEEFVQCINTPLLVFIYLGQMCWFRDSLLFKSIKKMKKKPRSQHLGTNRFGNSWE